jgi:phage anti-repressor protein
MNNLKLTTVSNQTPIEIALQIDENGMTTASKLYEFLELNPSNFSRWCKKNITNNKFAEEKTDYFPYVIKEERYNPNFKTDYKITSDFAKQLSMTGNTEKHKQARQYFIACEQGLKLATKKLQLQELNYDTLANSISSIINNTLKPISDRLSNIEEKQNQQQIIQPKKNRMSSWTRKMFPKYKLLMEYFNISRIELYHNLYIELENLNPNIDIQQLQEDYSYENGLETCFALDAIEHNESIRDSFENMVNNLLIKYHLTDDITKQEYKPTIFDDDYDYIEK